MQSDNSVKDVGLRNVFFQKSDAPLLIFLPEKIYEAWAQEGRDMTFVRVSQRLPKSKE